MVDFSPRAAEVASSKINEMLCPMLDKAIVERSRKEYAAGRGSGEGAVAGKRIGAGYIGIECGRELAFKYHKFPIEPRDSGTSPGELSRHAAAGHWTEAMTSQWLRMVGVSVETFDHAQGESAPKQIGWMDSKDPASGQYRLAGEVDGVITAVEDPQLAALIKPPTVWESKKATDKKWKKFAKDGVKGADKRYYGQLQTNMGYLGISQTLFSMLNLETMKFYFELVPFDQMYAQGLVNRAVDTFNTQDPFEVPRLPHRSRLGLQIL